MREEDFWKQSLLTPPSLSLFHLLFTYDLKIYKIIVMIQWESLHQCWLHLEELLCAASEELPAFRSMGAVVG